MGYPILSINLTFYFFYIISINQHKMPGIAIVQCYRTDYETSYID